MKEEATVYDDKGDEPVYQYVGKLTELFNRLKLSTPYYTSVRGLLIDMRCIEQTRRGGGGSDSVWMLFDDPTPALYFDSTRGGNRRKRVVKVTDTLQQQVNDLNRRLLQMENMLAVLQGSVGTLQRQVMYKAANPNGD